MNNREQIVSAAESLFFAKGFKAVSLQEISTQMKIKPASLYYYFPGGKEEIYLEVIRCRTIEFKSALEGIAFRNHNLRSILTAFGLWYIEQPPMNMILIADMDMPFLSPKGRKLVTKYVGTALFEPLGQLFMNCRNEIREGLPPHLLVSTFNVLLFSIRASVKMGGIQPKDLVDHIVEVFLNGVSKK